MYHKVLSALICAALLGILCGCGEDAALTKFKKDIDSFCSEISTLDTAINSIEANSPGAKYELLDYLDEADESFKHFSQLDFPEEFDYLESLADEASEYMTEAVSYYHETYSNGSYNETTAEYAKENYLRAFRRIQIIITFLHGEEPKDVNLTIETSSEGVEENE